MAFFYLSNRISHAYCTSIIFFGFTVLIFDQHKISFSTLARLVIRRILKRPKICLYILKN
jgi:hypothetical protein